jgi:pyruvate dehydrogenase E1 component alpha subunit
MDRAISIWRKMTRARHFELNCKKAMDDGHVKALVYLGLGQESIAAAVSVSMRGLSPYILGQHRSHPTYLSFGGNPESLVLELRGSLDGCSGGKGGSPMIQDRDAGIIGHCGLIGDQVPVACGMALAGDRPVVCFFGDGAAEEDYVLSALGFAATHKLNILFVCEDNGLSVLTPTAVRRSWDICNVAQAFGITVAANILDDPWTIDSMVTGMLRRGLPALLNVQTRRMAWHVGSGSDGPPEWDRYKLTKDRLIDMGLGVQASDIEIEAADWARELWR